MTLHRRAAVPALHHRGVSPPVEKENALFAPVQPVVQRSHQNRRKNRRVRPGTGPRAGGNRVASGTIGGLVNSAGHDGTGTPGRFISRKRQVTQHDTGTGAAVDALGQFQAPVLTGEHVVQALQGRSRGTQNRHRPRFARPHQSHVPPVIARSLFLFVGRLVFLVHDDQAKVGHGNENRRTRPHHHRHGALASPPPDVTPLGLSRLRMKEPRSIPEPSPDPREDLGTHGDLRHQEQHLPARGDDLASQPKVNLGLSAPRDPVEKKRRERSRVEPRRDRFDGARLSRKELRLCLDARSRVDARTCRARPTRRPRRWSLGFLAAPVSASHLADVGWQCSVQHLPPGGQVVVGHPTRQRQHGRVEERLLRIRRHDRAQARDLGTRVTNRHHVARRGATAQGNAYAVSRPDPIAVLRPDLVAQHLAESRRHRHLGISRAIAAAFHRTVPRVLC